MDLSFFATGIVVITIVVVAIGFFAAHIRKFDTTNTVREIPKPTWPRTKLEEDFGV